MCSAHMYAYFCTTVSSRLSENPVDSQLVSAGAKLPVTYREPGLCRDHRDRGSVHHPSIRHYHAHGTLQ